MDNHFTHVDAAGNARMVDVGEKAVTHRTAVAVGRVTMSPECFAAVAEGRATTAEAIEEVKLRSRQYAKRQLTWLRRNEAIHWILWEKTPDFSAGLQNATEFLLSAGVC